MNPALFYLAIAGACLVYLVTVAYRKRQGNYDATPKGLRVIRIVALIFLVVMVGFALLGQLTSSHP